MLLTRRRLLHSATTWVGCAGLNGPAWAAPAGRAPALPLLAAAWDDADGRHHVGVLQVQAGTPARLQVRHAIEVPTRAHVVTPCPDGALLAVARRPGSWMLRWQPGSPATQATWRWAEPDRSFNGHVVLQRGGLPLSTETDAETGVGLLVKRDPRTLAVLEEWPTAGIDAHALLALPDGSWLVANGGVPTRPESGRVKLARQPMDTSLVRLDARGRLLSQWRLADPALSLRHLALHTNGTVGVALQAEHEDPAQRQTAPLLALWDGQGLRCADAAPLAGYAGDIVALPEGFALGATRAGCVARYGLQGELLAQPPLPQAGALAPWGRGGWLAAGQGGLLASALPETGSPVAAGGALRIDNHWAVWRP